jgi:DNA polymerase III epsilon subunit-like protein
MELNQGMLRKHLRLNELWPVIQPFINDKFVVAHNARFDIGVLRTNSILIFD